jgi:hypothetical protein
MDEAGDRTMLFQQWVHGISAVSVAEVLDFAAYADMRLAEVISRLRLADV